MPHLHIIAGPNGSGKSSFVREVRNGDRIIHYSIPAVINPDELAAAHDAANPDAYALAAGREALLLRNTALLEGRDFAIETTFSGNSERQLITSAKEHGYTVGMSFFALSDSDRNVWRVEQRTLIERRTVPPEDVRRRYDRSLRNLAGVVPLLDTLDVYDNSGPTFVHVLTIAQGIITKHVDPVPAWVARALGGVLA